MKKLQIIHLSYCYPTSSLPILKDINIELTPIWNAIVGVNGSGKSTLLKLIAKELGGHYGVIRGNELVYYVPQSTENEPKDIEIFMQTYTSDVCKIRDSLGLEYGWENRWEQLSHGERKKVQIAIALFMQPDVLLLDEPTNHLDKKSKEAIFFALESFDGVGVVVSHDRGFLDRLTKRTLFLKNAQITIIDANYSLAQQEYQKKIYHEQREQEKIDKKVQSLQEKLTLQKEKVLESKKRLSKKNISTQDSDARAKINLARLTGKDKKDAGLIKRLSSKQKQLQKEFVGIEKKYKTTISIEGSELKNMFPFFIPKGRLALDTNRFLYFDTLRIEENDKIGLVGENGSGKSRFIEYLLCTLDFKEQLFYIPQEIELEKSKEILNEIKMLPKEKKGEIFSIVQRLKSDPKLLLESTQPSPGEIRKLLLAQGLLAKPIIIILDEPTNHMDIDSIHAIEDALAQYNKAIIIVSHDEVFLKNIVTSLWSFKKLKEGGCVIEV